MHGNWHALTAFAKSFIAGAFVLAAGSLSWQSTAAAQDLRADCIRRSGGQSVVHITYKFQTSAGDHDEVQGSGFLISPDGYVITAAHVVRPPAIYTSPVTNAEVEVKVGSYFSQSYASQVITKIDDLDVALVKLPALSAPWPVAQVDVLPSEQKKTWLFGLGFPAGGDLTSAGPGKITAPNAVIGGKPTLWWNTDLPLNEGMSGGPIFNEFGEVSGIAGAIKSSSGGSISYVIPIALASSLIGAAGISDYNRSPCADDPREFMLGFITEALSGQYNRQNIAEPLWQVIQAQTGGTNRYPIFADLGDPIPPFDVLDQKNLPAGTFMTVKVTHQNGTSLWSISYNRFNRKIDSSFINPLVNKARPSPTPVTVATYSVCIGEHAEACFGHTHLGCGTNIDGWATVTCRNSHQTTQFKTTQISSRGGNKCGYGVYDVACLGP